MSEMVHYKGTLKQIDRLENETLEQQCKRLLNNKELPSWCVSYRELFEDEYYRHYLIYNGWIFKLDYESVDLDEDLFKSSKGKDDLINFEIRYYNGGCGFGEAIKHALDNLE